MSAQQVKYTVEHYRAEGISQEAFVKWFKEYHVPIGVPLMKKYGITKYTVQVRNHELATGFEPHLHKIRPTWEVSKADLVLEYWMPELSCLYGLVSDAEWNEKALKGQDQWLDMSRSTTHITNEETYLEGGNILKLA